MKLYVEMTGEEYEKYKIFSKGEFMSKEAVEKMSLDEFLTEIKGFKKTASEVFNQEFGILDPLGRKPTCVIATYKKGNAEVHFKAQEEI